MIISKLTLYNFGVYAGENTFEFHSEKPVVLIGGMNGQGKTTFLEAVLLALYGPNSFAFNESRYSELYEALIRAWCVSKSLPLDDEILTKYFKLHLERGIAHLSGTNFIKDLDDLLQLAIEA